jgi:hypothetical protein
VEVEVEVKAMVVVEMVDVVVQMVDMVVDYQHTIYYIVNIISDKKS